MSGKQYISVSGVGTVDQIECLERSASRYESPASPTMLMGIQATEKSQFHKIENSRGRAWHPVGDDIWRLFSTSREPRIAKRIIHYSYADNPSADSVEQLTSEVLSRMPDTCQVDGWQFNNLNWLDYDYASTIEHTKARVGSEFIIAQLSNATLSRSNPTELSKRLAGSGVSHALLDSSGGNGQAFNESVYRHFVDTLHDHAPNVGVGIAGGLGPGEDLDSFRSLLSTYPSLSCDAEGKLRLRTPDGVSLLDNELASRYTVEACEAIKVANTSFGAWWTSAKLDYLNPLDRHKLSCLHRNLWERVRTAPGSSHNHQAWPGGYMEHIRQVNEFAVRLYGVWQDMGVMDMLARSNEYFTLAEALVVTSIHDLEKIFRYRYDESGNLAIDPALGTKQKRTAFRHELITKYGIELSSDQIHALNYVEGLRDTDYTPDHRVISPLATFVHVCDFMSARAGYNLGKTI